MGYIVPINHEQYTQYANRQMPVKIDPIKLYPVKEATLKAKFENQRYELILNYGYVLKKSRKEDSQHMIATITGKGKFIDELI